MAGKPRKTKQQVDCPAPFPAPTALAEVLLPIHSAATEAWLVEAASAAAERSLGALYTFIFLADSRGELRGLESPAEARQRSLGQVHRAVGQPLARLRLPVAEGTLVGRALGEHRIVTSERLEEVLGHVVGAGACVSAQAELGIVLCCLSPIEMSAEQLGLALFFFGGEQAPLEEARLLCEHMACALLNLRRREEARHLGELDAVRWVPDERALREQLRRELGRATRHGRPVSVMLLRVTDLGEIRTNFGRFLADRLLRSLGGALSDQLRGTDFLSAYGDDGFALVMPETDREAAARAAERLLPFATGVRLGGEAGPTPELSLGLATYPEDGSTSEAILAAAEAHLRSLASVQPDEKKGAA